MRRNKMSAFCLLAILASLFLFVGAMAQAQNERPVLITEAVNESKLVTLAGNTRPEAMVKQNDRGRVADSYPMEHMMLQLKRSPEQGRELQQLIDELTDSSSPNFHHWLTAKDFGERYGLAQQDLDAIVRWLQSYGFQVNVLYENRLLIDFSGTAGQVREAFHTEIHDLNVKGEKHIANVSNPRIPAAVAVAVSGIVSLHDFKPHAMYKRKADYTFTTKEGPVYAVVPADLATIYNLNPLFNAQPTSISGQGQTIVLIEDSNVYSTSDWDNFRSVFGLSSYTDGSFTQVHPKPPSGPNNCINPDTNLDDFEATLDVEYASASAPSAAIELASCLSTSTFGGLIALQNLLNASSPPPAVMSMSYGECEGYSGAALNAAFYSAYQQAVTEGVSMYVSAGDDGASSCSNPSYSWAATGIGVSGFASTPYNVAVGGTDFGDTYAETNSTYWSSTNSSTYGSALSYIPEIPWNDSCGSELLSWSYGYTVSYGYNGFCYSAMGLAYYDATAGSGGPSGCATGESSQPGIVGGTCAGYPKPSWQSLTGVPNDGVRDLPDISLFAADGVWWHYYLVCFSDPSYDATCSGAPDTWPGAGGTSFSSPIMAGIQALINQKTGERQGNPNPTYYSLAANEYGASGDSSCQSNPLGSAPSSSCIFYDVIMGDNDIDCQGVDCYWPTEAMNSPSDPTVGSLTTDPTNNSYQAAYAATTGWDFATGIGSVNAANLVNSWPEPAPGFTFTSNPNAMTIIHGNSGTSAITIIPQGGFSGNVNLSASGLPNGVTATFNPTSTSSNSTLTLTVSATAQPATATLTITGTSGNLTGTAALTLTITTGNPAFTLSSTPGGVTIVQGAGSGTTTINVTPENGFSGGASLSASGLPKGVTAVFSVNPITTSSQLTFTASETAKTGTATVTITGTSGSLSATTTIAVTVNPLGNFTVTDAPKTLTVARGSSGTSTITVNPKDGFAQSVALTASGLPKSVTATFSENPTASTATVTLTVGNSAPIGEFAITITGVYGTRSHEAFLTLSVDK
jgi:subtilase family serine protease